jgi:hypothetical protein
VVDGFEELFFIEADLAGDDCAHGGAFRRGVRLMRGL